MFDLFYLLVKSLAKPRDSYKKFPVNNSLASSSNTIEALSWHISTYWVGVERHMEMAIIVEKKIVWR